MSIPLALTVGGVQLPCGKHLAELELGDAQQPGCRLPGVDSRSVDAISVNNMSLDDGILCGQGSISVEIRHPDEPGRAAVAPGVKESTSKVHWPHGAK